MASEKETKFEFVVSTPSHNASTQRETKRFVRKHVMRRFKRHPSPPRTVFLEDEALTEYLAERERRAAEKKLSDTSEALVGSPSNTAALSGASHLNPFGTYPINMGSKDHELVHHIWASNQVVFQPFRDFWFSLGMMDAAAMHLVIANAAVHRKALRTSREDDFLALTHSQAAITSVTQRIANYDQNITDEMMGAVLGLMCHGYLNLNFENAIRHIRGFQRILQLRGGLSTIESSISIRLSLFWIEHNIAVAQDIIPQFPPPLHLMKMHHTPLSSARGLLHRDKAMQTTGIFTLISIEMLEIFTRLSVLTVTLSPGSIPKISWDDPNFPGFSIYPILNQLLMIQTTSNDDKDLDAVQEMCRLGCILYIAEIRRRFRISPILTNVQTEKLHTLFEMNEGIWREDLDCIRIWTIVMAGCVATTKVDRTWAVKALIRSRANLVYKNWDEIIDMVSELWWIDEVFSSRHQELQNEYNESVTTI